MKNYNIYIYYYNYFYTFCYNTVIMRGIEFQGPLFAPHSEANGHRKENSDQLRRRITPEAFIEDGNSRQAREFANQWMEAQQEGDLTALIMCSDARTIYNPKNAVGIRTIAAAVPQELYGNVLSRSFGTKNVVVMSHHDGRRLEPGIRPPGCGGRDEKAKMRDALETPESEGALRYVREHVAHEDPIIGAWYSALAIAEQSQLPVLAVSQDHIKGELIPLGVVEPTSDGGVKYFSEISLRQILQGQYNPEEIYANGIPALPHDRIPDDFKPFLRRHQRYLDELKLKNPNLEQNQAVQNPDTVLITTVVRPSRGRLPHFSGESSNRMFTITVARQPGDETGDVDEQSIVKAADEVQYPLAHGLASKGDSTKPFSDLFNAGTVVVETRNMARSRRVAEFMLGKPWFQEWATNNGNRIIVAQTSRGIVDNAEYYDPKELTKIT
jgi:hypothetical protein